MVLLYSLPAPTSSQSTVVPIIVAYLSPLPFYFILIYQLIRQKCCKTKKELIRRISIDTLSKTTHQLSEAEAVVPIIGIPSQGKLSKHISVLGGMSSDSEQLEIK